MDTQLGARQGGWTPAVHRDRAQRCEKAVWRACGSGTPDRPVSRAPQGWAADRESFEKQPVRAGAEACECTLSNQRSGTGIGDAVRNHVVIPAAVFAQSEPDRTTVEVRQTLRSLRSLPADLRSVSSCHPRGSRRSFNHSRRKAEVADDAQVPAIRRWFTHGRVRYSRGEEPRPLKITKIQMLLTEPALAGTVGLSAKDTPSGAPVANGRQDTSRGAPKHGQAVAGLVWAPVSGPQNWPRAPEGSRSPAANTGNVRAGKAPPFRAGGLTYSNNPR